MTGQRDHLFFDDLADVMRRACNGLMRPLWNDLTAEQRAAERDRAANLLRYLEIHGFTIQRTQNTQQETAEC